MLRLPMVCAQVVEHTARDVLIFESPDNWQNIWDTYWTERFATTGLENLPAKFWEDRIAETHPTDEARQRATFVELNLTLNKKIIQLAVRKWKPDHVPQVVAPSQVVLPASVQTKQGPQKQRERVAPSVQRNTKPSYSVAPNAVPLQVSVGGSAPQTIGEVNAHGAAVPTGATSKKGGATAEPPVKSEVVRKVCAAAAQPSP